MRRVFTCRLNKVLGFKFPTGYLDQYRPDELAQQLNKNNKDKDNTSNINSKNSDKQDKRVSHFCTKQVFIWVSKAF